MSRVKDLEALLLKYSEEYYNGESTISDSKFDKLSEELKSLDPNNEFFSSVGSKIKGKKVKLENIMGSLQKEHNVEDVLNWIVKNSIQNILISEKLDGLALEAKYENGKITQLVTRGDGSIGRDVSQHIDYITNLPKNINHNNTLWVRGEGIMYITDFELYNRNLPEKDRKANPRNLASGTINSDNPCPDRKIYFKAYSVIGLENGMENDDLNYLKDLGFDTCVFYTSQDKGIITRVYDKYIESIRDSLHYNIDGLVIKANNKFAQARLGSIGKYPKWAKALKFPADEAVTEIEGVVWNHTKTGVYSPIALLKPTILDGTVVKRASLHNVDFISNKHISIGSVVKIKKGGDIIPYIVEVLSNDKAVNNIDFPTNCNCCNFKLDFVAGNPKCMNISCDRVRLGRLQHWVKNLDIDQLGDKSIEKLFDSGLVKEINDLYNLDCSKYVDILGKNGEKAYKSLHSNKVLTLNKFFSGLMIDGVSSGTIEILEKNGCKTIDNVLNVKEAEVVKYEGIAIVKGNQIVKGINSLRGLIMLLKDLVEIKNTEKSGNLKGKSFCITGALSQPKDKVYKLIEDSGGEAFKNVKKGLDYLIVADPTKKTSKLEKAEKMGVTIISEDDLLSLLTFVKRA